MRPDVGTQSLAASIDERFDTSLFTRQHDQRERRHYYEYALVSRATSFDNILVSLMIIEVLEDVQVRALLGEP